MSLATKYRPKSFEEMTEQKFVVDILNNMCSSTLSNRNFLFIGPAGCGKAQPLYSQILTPDGFIAMRDVQIGTKVYTHQGHLASVTGVYPQGVRDIYEITLQDRTKIRVADNHLNFVYRYNEDKHKREDYVLETTELISLFNSSRFKLRIDTPCIRETMQPSALPIDPCLLGILIGDGSLSSGNLAISNAELDIIDIADAILRRDFGLYLKKLPGDNVDWTINIVDKSKHKYEFQYKTKVYHGVAALIAQLVSDGYPAFDPDTVLRLANNCAYNVMATYPELSGQIQLLNVSDTYAKRNPLRDILEGLGLCCKSVDKHIPKLYLLASYADRLALFRGLFATDGYLGTNGSTDFYTSSPQLSEDFAFLARSLGIRDTVSQSPAHYRDSNGVQIDCHDVYSHHLHIPNDLDFCLSSKHKCRWKPRQNPPIRNIVSIEYIGKEQCQCIMIDDDDHTYISDGFIPTHNTTLARIIGNNLNENRGNIIEIDGATYNGVEKTREIVAQAKSFPVGSRYKIFIVDECHALSAASWAVLLKLLEESPAATVMILCTTNPEKIPDTILSRVQTFQLSKISLQGIVNRLKYVLDAEIAEGVAITYDESAVSFVAKLANGGMRDALTLLDKALAYSKDITEANLAVALNLPNYDDYFKCLGAITKKDNEKIIALIDQVYNSGVNFIRWFEGFHAFVINVVEYIYTQDINKTKIPAQYVDRISKYTVAHAAVCLMLSKKLLVLNHELKTTNYQQELAITHLCTPQKSTK